jgi:hypothetical protein
MAEQIIDSLLANEFSVEINEAVVSGVFRVAGLTLFKASVDATLTITKMVQRDPALPFNQWLRDTLAANGSVATRTLTVTAVDDGTPVRRWTFGGARVQDVTYSDFDSAAVEMAEERVVIAYDAVTHEWLTA